MNLDDPAYRHILSLPSDAPLETHYELLGVPLGESDPAVLEEAMLQQVIKVRRYQVGAYQSQAMALLNELGQAYVCLTDDELRREYERSLGLKRSQPTARAVPESRPVAKPTPPLAKPPQPTERTELPDVPGACPQCGKPMSPRTAICMHCNYRRAPAGATQRGEATAPAARGILNAGELLKQDLTPEQLLARLSLMRDMYQAQKLSLLHWTSTTINSCQLCGHHLTSSVDTYSIRLGTLSHLSSYVETYARRQQSQGRMQFHWPLSKEVLGQLQTAIVGTHPQAVRQFCRNCADKLFRSGRV